MAIDLTRRSGKLEQLVQPYSELVEVVTIEWEYDGEITRRREHLTPAECLERFGRQPGPVKEVTVTVDWTSYQGR